MMEKICFLSRFCDFCFDFGENEDFSMNKSCSLMLTGELFYISYLFI